MLNWLRRFNIFCFLDSCDYVMAPNRYDCLVAAGARDMFTSDSHDGLAAFIGRECEWKFGHLGYRLKNSLHHFSAVHTDSVGFAGACFFIPEVVIALKGSNVEIWAEEPIAIWQQINQQSVAQPASSQVMLQEKTDRETYISTVRRLQDHIRRGDCYEINYCIEFFNEQADIDPYSLYAQLSAVSPNPFAAFYRNDNSFLLCASPERFLAKDRHRLISQPIKGTIRRDLNDRDADDNLKELLRNSKKDQSENVMVVDLVRNDLSQVCKDNSVKVNELFGIYSFPQVHQMISTVSGEMRPDVSFEEMLKALFPMGSMTGAPKHRVMQLIDQYESSERGIFSGSVGYVDPLGDFDFNVVIRSLMYNTASKYLSCQVGSGITFYSDAEKEWEECLLKAAAIRKVLGDK